MTERDMEDLLAAYPDEFFPRKTLVLKGRQQSFVGVGRFDLLFVDQFQTNVLIELKARAAKYEDATQVAAYKDELERRGEKNVLMWLVAPQIPKSVGEFLDRIGIQYSEIHFGEFRHVAQRHGVILKSETSISLAEAASSAKVGVQSGARTQKSWSPRTARFLTATVDTGPRVTIPGPLRWKALGRDLMLQNPDVLDQDRLGSLVDAFEQSVPSGRNARLIADLRNWAANPRSKWDRSSCCSLLRWVTTSGWKDAVPHAEGIWNYLFGKPAPTWYVWDQSRRKYDLDNQGWNLWYESLPH